MISHTSRALIGGLALFAIGTTGAPAIAQDGSEEARLRKIEAEVRALQRTVFPGGDGRYFEPQISGQNGSASRTTAGSTTALTDVLARLDAMELQLQRLTAQTEENTNSIMTLTAQMAQLQSGNGTAGGTGIGGGTVSPAPTPALTTSQPSTPTPAPVAGPSAERLAAVQAITKPDTDDAGDDEYSYGYRLWNAGFYPEAQQQLTLFVDKHPNHSRTTYGRNLLGRAYLDAGNAEAAAPWFLRNYQANKQAARAPDSLLYLAEAMIALKDTDRACIALSEFGETYPAIASGRLSDKYESNRQKVSCN